MAAENPTWGAPRIHRELLKLGFEVSERTVSRYRPKRPPNPDKIKPWMAFLKNHRNEIAALDFFIIPLLTFKVLYVRVIIHPAHRVLLYVQVTFHPTAQWVIQQLREAFPYDSATQRLIFDRDSIFIQRAGGGYREILRHPTRADIVSKSWAERRGGALDRQWPPGVVRPGHRLPPTPRPEATARVYRLVPRRPLPSHAGEGRAQISPSARAARPESQNRGSAQGRRTAPSLRVAGSGVNAAEPSSRAPNRIDAARRWSAHDPESAVPFRSEERFRSVLLLIQSWFSESLAFKERA